MDAISRRGLARLAGGAALAAPIAGRAAALDLTTPPRKLEAFLKVYTSIGSARVWYWYNGVVDASLPGGPVVPLFGVDTLIRRDMRPLGGGRYALEMFEGSYFHAVDNAAPLDGWHNPLNDREVHAFHYREGPYRVAYDVRGASDPVTGKVYPGAEELGTRWRIVGDQLWFSRDLYLDYPHPLPIDTWPMEASGRRQTAGSFATHWASAAEVADPAIVTARSAFHYEAFMDWLPWMLMAQAPGRMVWRGAGTKLARIADLPATARAGFEATHPRLFDEVPWTDFANMGLDYQRLRKPAPR